MKTTKIKRLVAGILLLVALCGLNYATANNPARPSFCFNCNAGVGNIQVITKPNYQDNKDGRTHNIRTTVSYHCTACGYTWGNVVSDAVVTNNHNFVKQSYNKSRQQDHLKCVCGADTYGTHRHNITTTRTLGFSRLGFWKYTDKCNECGYTYSYFSDD